MVMDKWGLLQYSVSFYVCLNFSLLKKLQKSEQKDVFFLFSTHVPLKGELA